MANMKRQAVGYRPFRAEAFLSEGLLPVARPGGELEAKVAEGMFRMAGIAGAVADREAERRGALAGELDALAGRPAITFDPGEDPVPQGGGTSVAPGQPFRTDDPVASDLPAEARAFLNAIAGGESGGRYNVRYTPKGGELFSDLSRHPGIFEPGPHGKSSAAGRYQFTQTTWNRMGGGDFSPANQDRRAWQLAQDDYRARTGRPLLADLQAGGVTPTMLSALTPTWQAFKGNRQRHIATYNDSLQRMVGRGEVPPPRQDVAPQVDPAVRAPGVTPSIEVSGGSYRPSRRDTIYGRAYDAAGTRTYLQALNNEVERTTEQVFEKYRDDPATLAEAMQVLKGEQLREHVFDEIRAEYELTFDRAAGRRVMQAQRELEVKEAQANRAAFLSRTTELEESRSRALAGLDPDDETTVQTLRAIQRQLDDHYDAAVAHDIIDQGTAEQSKRASQRATAKGFYMAQADKLASEEVGILRDAMRADYAAGRLDGIDAQGWQELESGLTRLEEQKRRDEDGAAKSLADRGAAIAARVEMGFEADPAEVAQLQLDVGTSPDGPEIVGTALDMVDVATVFRDRPLSEARQHVADMRGKLGTNPSDRQIAVMQYAEGRLAELEKMAAEDPVAYEIQTGRMALDIIDTSSPEALAGSLAKRRQQMEMISERYGTDFQFFRPQERSALAKALVDNPDGFPDFVTALRGELGEKAATALAELSEDAPTLSHAAGLAIATRDNAIAVDVAQALSAKAQGLYAAKMPAADQFARHAGPQFAGALYGLDRTRAATLATAQLLYERDANLLGFDPSEIGKEGTPAAMAWRRALERSLGAQYRAGRQTGGLGEVNGGAIVVPTGMEPERPQQLLANLTETQIGLLPPIMSANGVDVSASQLRQARLMTVGDGLYRVALGDPSGWDPQWVIGQDGEFWVLDLRQLEDMPGAGGAWRSGQSWRRSPFGWQVPDAIE